MLKYNTNTLIYNSKIKPYYKIKIIAEYGISIKHITNWK